MALNLEEYLTRIGYEGSLDPTFDTLCAMQRHHVYAIPYENLDVYLQCPVTVDIEACFEKIVHRQRGGWCYEMNGLLGWALGEIGFDVTRLCGGVGREFAGDIAMGGHLVLRVDMDDVWIVDVGLGNAATGPLKLEAGAHQQGERLFHLEHLEEHMWRFRNHEGLGPPSCDFLVEGTDEARLALVCANLQDNEESMFRQNLMCLMMGPKGHTGLVGRVFTDAEADGKKRLVASEDEHLSLLANRFDLKLPDTTGLWDKVVHRHAELFGDKPLDEIEF